LKVVTEEAVRMSDGKLFHAVGPATQNALLPRRRLVRGTTRSPRAAERRAARVETVVTGYSWTFSHRTPDWHLGHTARSERSVDFTEQV